MAARAGVDPALVHHYYGTKEKLFTAAIQVPVDPMEVLTPMRTAPVEELGLTLPSVLLPLWDNQPGFVASLRSLISGADVGFARSYLQEIVTEVVGSRVDDPPGTGRIRAQFVVTQLIGVVMARHIVKIEPFASLPWEEVAQTIAPNLQRYLTGDLPEGLTP